MAKTRSSKTTTTKPSSNSTSPPSKTKRTTKTKRSSNTTRKRRGEFIARPLCFTTTYKRPYYIYNTINNILNNQSYTNIKYVVGISINQPEEQSHYEKILSDFVSDKRIEIFYHKNMDQHDNYLYPIKNIDYHKYNLFIKIDDDDIYKNNYIENIITEFSRHQIDIISCKTKYIVNKDHIEEGAFDTVGGVWQPDTQSDIKFGMPFTYAFNNKALDVILKLSQKDRHQIHHFEDPAWRTKWREEKLKSHVIQDYDQAIYNMHYSNVSSPQRSSNNVNNDAYKVLENEFCSICLFKHNYWESYVFLNKRNNRMFHINNNDHGAFEFLDNGNIKIIWDNWGEEIFYKKYTHNKNYYYEI